MGTKYKNRTLLRIALAITVINVVLLLVFLRPSNAAFNEMITGARPQGMGGAFTGLADDANTLYWNPAGMTRLDRYEATAMHARKFSLDVGPSLDVDYGGITTGKQSWGSLGVSWSREGDKSIISEEILALSYAREIISGLSMGLSIKSMTLSPNANGITAQPGVLDPALVDQDTTGIDIGLLYDINNYFTLGVVGRNIGAETGKVIKTELEPGLRVGVAYKPNRKFKIAADVTRRENIKNRQGESSMVAGGVEYLLSRFLAIRAGVNDDTMTLGLGFLKRDWQMDYAFWNSEIGDTHRISATMRFNEPFGETEKKSALKCSTGKSAACSVDKAVSKKPLALEKKTALKSTDNSPAKSASEKNAEIKKSESKKIENKKIVTEKKVETKKTAEVKKTSGIVKAPLSDKKAVDTRKVSSNYRRALSIFSRLKKGAETENKKAINEARSDSSDHIKELVKKKTDKPVEKPVEKKVAKVVEKKAAEKIIKKVIKEEKPALEKEVKKVVKAVPGKNLKKPARSERSKTLSFLERLRAKVNGRKSKKDLKKEIQKKESVKKPEKSGVINKIKDNENIEFSRKKRVSGKTEKTDSIKSKVKDAVSFFDRLKSSLKIGKKGSEKKRPAKTIKKKAVKKTEIKAAEKMIKKAHAKGVSKKSVLKKAEKPDILKPMSYGEKMKALDKFKRLINKYKDKSKLLENSKMDSASLEAIEPVDAKKAAVAQKVREDKIRKSIQKVVNAKEKQRVEKKLEKQIEQELESLMTQSMSEVDHGPSNKDVSDAKLAEMIEAELNLEAAEFVREIEKEISSPGNEKTAAKEENRDGNFEVIEKAVNEPEFDSLKTRAVKKIDSQLENEYQSQIAQALNELAK